MGALKKAYILHGWTYSKDKYKNLANGLNKAGLETVILDVPGLTKKIDKPWDIDDYILWLKKILDKERGKVILIGHSNGGRIAANFAIKHPGNIAYLVLIDSAGIYHNELSIRLKRLLFKTVAKVGKKITTSLSLKNLLYKLAREEDYKKASPNARKTMLNLLQSDSSLNFSQIKTPSLIIWGKLDETTPLKDGYLINQQIKNSKLFLINSAKHSPHFTNPKKVGDIIIKELNL